MAEEPKYGSYDAIASRYNADEAWVLHPDKGWTEINRIDHGHTVRELTKEEFHQRYPDVPALPKDAFKT
jgi:hypothetical protein